MSIAIKTRKGESILVENWNYNCGRFSCENEAAKAYNKKSLELHGEFGNRNVITKE
jgi:hypothetical protein